MSAPAFKDALKGKRIDKLGLTCVYTRLFGKPDISMLRDELERRIKTFGVCQCKDKSCKKPLNGYCEFDHTTPKALAKEGSTVYWRALTKACHYRKTNGPRGDTNMVAHTKRIANGLTQHDKRLAKGGTRMQGRGFEAPPPGRKAFQSRGFQKPGDYKPNVKQLDEL